MNEQIRNSKNILIIAISIVITALIVGAGMYAWQSLNQETKISTSSTNADWNIYVDEKAKFSIKYPVNIALDKSFATSLSLSIRVEKVDSLINETMHYDKETALNDEKELAKGNYGRGADFSLPISRKVRNLEIVNGQEFMVLSRFEVCDVTFERKLIFYRNDYRVLITLHGDRDNIVVDNPKYFKIDQVNCGNIKVWDYEKSEQFYIDLERNTLTGDAQNWFNLFDDIINTMVIE